MERDSEAADAEALALADRVERQALVFADLCAVERANRAGFRVRQVPPEERRRFLLRVEADILALLVVLRERNAEGPCERDHVRFAHVPEGKKDAPELFPWQRIEEIALIFAAVGRFMEGRLVLCVSENACVMTGGNRITPEFISHGEERCEFHNPVAEHAGVRRAAALVLAQERIHHVPLKCIGDIPVLERKAEFCGDSVRAVYRLRIAAFAGEQLRHRRSERVAPERESHTKELMALTGKQMGGHAGIHTSGHSDENAHGRMIATLNALARNTARFPCSRQEGKSGMMPAMTWTVDQALEHWKSEKLLTEKQVRSLRKSLEGRGEAHLPNRALAIFGTIGAILVALGVILFFASNWSAMTPLLKVSVLLIGILLTAIAGYSMQYGSGRYPKVGAALLFLNVLLFGASIFLVAQIYHLQLNFWLGTALWFLVTAYFAYTLQSRLHAALAVLLLLLTIGWLRTALVSGFATEFDFLVGDRVSMLGLLPLFGITLIGANALHRRHAPLKFASDVLFGWGVFFTLIPIVISTAHREFFFQYFALPADPVAVVLLIAAMVITVWAAVRGNFEEDPRSRYGLVALALYTAYVLVLAQIPRILGYPEFNGYGGYLQGTEMWSLRMLFILHVVLTFVLHLIVLWFGAILRRPALVNVGMLGMVLLIMIQYFNFAYSMFDRSLFFIVGGALLLGMSLILERKRQHLLASF